MPKHAANRSISTVVFGFGLTSMLVFASVANATNRTDDHENSIKITTHIPESPLSVQSVNSDDFEIVVKLHNTTQHEVVVSPFLSVDLFHADGRPVQKPMRIGRNGFRMTDSVLEGISFVSIAAGKTHEIKVNLKRYMHDPLVIAGWRIKQAGDYQLKMRYQFDRKHAKKTLGKGCLTIDEPEQLWNQALEVDESFMVKFKVK